MMRALAVVLLLAGCSQPGTPEAHGPLMPTGTGYVQHEPGFSRLCADPANWGRGTCPQRPAN